MAESHDEQWWKDWGREISAAIDRMAHKKIDNHPFPTYTNGERRAEEKKLNKRFQVSTTESVRRALEQD